MEYLKTNKVLWILLAVTIFNLTFFVAGKFLIDKAAERVIEKLQKDYSPSPYGPGLDPDKMSPEGFKASKAAFEQREGLDNEMQFLSGTNMQTHGGDLSKMANVADAWRFNWEQDRGFNPAQ